MTLKKLMRPEKGSDMVLKTTRGYGLLVVDLPRDCISASSSATRGDSRLHGDGRALDGRGRVDLDEIEQVIEGHVAQAA